jgi:Na+/proline symporter
MSSIDWGIIAVYLIYIVWDGARRARNSRELEGYFLANRSLPWWAVGLSVIATQLSAITLVGTTGQAYAHGMSFIQFYYGLPLAMVVLCVTLVPFFHRAQVYTAYEYLERRFDAKTRSLTSFFFLVSRCMGAGVIIAAPSVILSIVLGWSEVTTIFAMGLCTTFYTMMGGVQAVTWTDVKQMVVIFAGVGVSLWVIVTQLPTDVSIFDGLRLAGATGRLTTVDLSWNLHNPYTLWSGLIGGFFLMLAYFGADQSQVQRYLTARSVGEARSSLLMSAFVKIPMQFVILLMGVLVFVFYQFHPAPLSFNPVEEARVLHSGQGPQYKALQQTYEAVQGDRRTVAEEYARSSGADRKEWLQRYVAANRQANSLRERGAKMIEQTTGSQEYDDVNYVFPVFILQHMPIGAIGLMIAAIFAAAMSSFSAEINALATTTIIDFYRRHYRPQADERHYVMVGRVATGIWGTFACVVAVYATSLGSLIEVVNRFGSFFYGSLLGVFVLAVGVPWSRAVGAFWGLLIGMATVWTISLYTDIAFLWYNVIGCVAVVVAGSVISLAPARKLRSETA